MHSMISEVDKQCFKCKKYHQACINWSIQQPRPYFSHHAASKGAVSCCKSAGEEVRGVSHESQESSGAARALFRLQ